MKNCAEEAMMSHNVMPQQRERGQHQRAPCASAAPRTRIIMQDACDPVRARARAAAAPARIEDSGLSWWKMLPGTCPSCPSTALPVQSCGISGGEFRKLTHGGRNLEGPEIEKLLNPNSLPKRGMRENVKESEFYNRRRQVCCFPGKTPTWFGGRVPTAAGEAERS